MRKRVFLVVLDSLGIGGAPDAAAYGDEGSFTLGTLAKSPALHLPNLQRLGLFCIDGLEGLVATVSQKGCNSNFPKGNYCRLREVSAGKDTTIGHWELAGIVSEAPLPTFPDGFPADMIAAFEASIGRGSLCHMPYSGTKVIRDFGEEHLRTGWPIV